MFNSFINFKWPPITKNKLMNYANYHIVLNGEKKTEINVLSFPKCSSYFTANKVTFNEKS